jgi:hypothetical protein
MKSSGNIFMANCSMKETKVEEFLTVNLDPNQAKE